MADLGDQGWIRFSFDRRLAAWAAHADRAALAVEAAPPPDMMRCDGTWFVGVNALANDAAGRLPGGPPLDGAAVAAARALVGTGFAFDRAQASVCYTNYPRQGGEEDDAAFRFRCDRDAAHVDGLHRVMPGRRRAVREVHGFILGIPLNDPPEGAAPVTIWDGSHHIMRAAFADLLGDLPPDQWGEVDVTAAYQAARRRCFETCKRRLVPALRGEAYLIHRLALHGVAPWGNAPAGRRAIAYFRPDLAGAGWAGQGDGWWLTAP
ncbi:MAG: hypothetical protein AAF367_16310 [Pseudomonadota bacterium]